LTGGASPAFARYIGIDYSGAATPLSSLKGLRVYLADRATPPVEVLPPPSPRQSWTRGGIAEWLAERLREVMPTLVGIDHGFSMPLRSFAAHHLPLDGPACLGCASCVGTPATGATAGPSRAGGRLSCQR
jgi:hypothetical protein